MIFENVCIIGCGLIGSSILRAIKNKKLSKIVSVYDKSKDVINFIKKENLSQNLTNDIGVAVKNADLVIIATPLSAYKEILLSIKDHLKKDVILTDTGSVKKEVNKIIENLNLEDIIWIPSHPIAGTEESGPSAGFAELFQNRWNIISPSKNIKKEHIERLSNFWESLGSKVKLMSISDHDNILSLTSHLPHAIAYNIVKTSIENLDQSKEDVIKFSAGGLRDFTRIASSDPIMWRDIFLDNSENILKTLNKFSINLEEFKKAINEKNGNKLLEIFLSTKNVRKEIVKAGQEVKAPDFGRKKN